MKKMEPYIFKQKVMEMTINGLKYRPKTNMIPNTFGVQVKGSPQNLVEGKVILRIPYLGWITLILKDKHLGSTVNCCAYTIASSHRIHYAHSQAKAKHNAESIDLTI